MKKLNAFAGLAVWCALLSTGGRVASAQSIQPVQSAQSTQSTQAPQLAQAALTAQPVQAAQSNQPAAQIAAAPAIYGNPFTRATATTSGAGSKVTGVATPLSSTQACAPVESTDPSLSLAFEPDPTGMGPGGAADSLSSPAPNPRPINPAIKTCESGRIIIRVENKRFYAYHVGDEIPISIKILADDGVQLDFTSLKQEILGFEGSDFLLIPVRSVSIASLPYAQRPHSTLYDIELSVQTFLTRPTVIFNLDLKYAIDVPPGVKQPNWRTLTTPDFVITNTPVITMPNDDEVDEGDLHPADMRTAWISWPLMVGGAFMVVWYGFLRRLVIRWNKMRPNRIVPAEEKAWNVFAKVFSDARDYGEFGAQYLRNIDAALRTYLAQSTKMNIESLSIKEIANLMENDVRMPTIVSALTKCETVIYARADKQITLSESEVEELYAELKQLVPNLED